MRRWNDGPFLASFQAAALLLCVLQAACSGSASTNPARSDAPLSTRLIDADTAHGERLFRQCEACHNLRPDAPDRDGPNLWGVFGSPVGTNSKRFAYTAALRDFGGRWTCARMDLWLTNPSRLVPGTRMAFAGLPDGTDRADVIAYILKETGGPARAVCPQP